MSSLSGQTIAGYEVIEKIGEGGMGAVYKARQPSLNRLAALKVMASNLATDAEFVARFKREASLAANLNHQNIVLVYGAGTQDKTHYIVMEFVEGETLRQRIAKHGRIEPREAVAITVYIAQALQYAWSKCRLIHRDIKPDNIFVSKTGDIKVGDLGLAKSVGSETTGMTATGLMMGSPHYISPEQASANKDIDFRTDIYSLGCTLYHMLTGQPPYEGSDPLAVISKHVHEPPPAIFKVLPQCPMPLALMLGKMLAKKPHERPQSYEQLIAQLREVHEKLAPVVKPPPASASEPTRVATPTPTPAAAKTPKPMKLGLVIRDRRLVMGGAVAVVVVLLAGLLLWSPWKTSSSIPNPKSEIQNSARPVDDAFLREVAALPAEEQVARVVAKLKELNPTLDLARTTHRILPEERIELLFEDEQIRDLSPLAALKRLERLERKGDRFTGRAPLSDLSALRGLDLKYLSLRDTQVSDLSALRGMHLDTLILRGTLVSDLSPLRGMPLRHLQVLATPVSDLSPLAGMPLQLLYCTSTQVRDLSVLSGMPLRIVNLDFKRPEDLALVRSIKTLEVIRGLPAAEFWKQVEAGKMPGPSAADVNKPAVPVSDANSLANPKAGEARLLDLGGGVKMEVVAIPPGEFMLGSTKEEQAWAVANRCSEETVKCEGEAPRKAAIKRGFWMGRTEVTVGQWKQFVKETGYVTDGEKKGESYVAGFSKSVPKKGVSWRNPDFGFEMQDDHPVSCISWNDAVAFCEWLTEGERKAGRLAAGMVVRLPTEAEWEYACRAGWQTKFWWGDSKEDGKGRLNWGGKDDGFEFVAPVDSYDAWGRNRLGLADMLGNVWEWCSDEYDSKQAHEECYQGNSGGRVLRGGSFNHTPAICRAATRYSYHPSYSNGINGFRVCVGAVR